MSKPPSQRGKIARQLVAIEQCFGQVDFLPAIQLPKPPKGSTAAADRSVRAASADTAKALSPPQKQATLEQMNRDEVSVCTKCVLHKTRTNTVFGEGDFNAELVFVGEGPGADEDRTGRPFVGRAGDLLTKMITAMGLSREGVFICNVVKCRPPGNRNPAAEEVQACWGYLVRQLQIIRPKVIVTLGNPATQTLLDTKTGITRLRGSWQQLGEIGEGLAGTAVMPTFHPSYLLRQYTPENRKKVWSDLQTVMKALGLKSPKSS
jgi:DNA polymerase